MPYQPQGYGGKPITKLSELEIDTDKDWVAKGISSIKELASGMQRGDIIIKGAGGVLKKLTPGPVSYELTSKGPGYEVEWRAPPLP